MYCEEKGVEQCKKDLLYLVGDVPDWIDKPHLYSALISHLTTTAGSFKYDFTTARQAYEELVAGR